MKIVPNLFPTAPDPDVRIAFIGEAPGPDEELTGRPFVGAAGRLLRGLIASLGVNPQACFFGNICQVRPPGNDVSRFPANSPERQNSLSALTADLEKYNPNLCVLLGNAPLSHALPGTKVGNLRGSVFMSSHVGPFLNRKCLPALHPAFCLRSRSDIPILKFDIQKAIAESRTRDVIVPERNSNVQPSIAEIETYLFNIRDASLPVSLDIEGYVGDISCISFAVSHTSCIIVPFTYIDGRSYWATDAEEARVWRAVAAVLADPKVPKILQNSLYDNFVLSYSYRCPIVNVADDTMLKHWELYCELPKALAFQASIYTNEPYYKAERKVPDTLTHFTYCCKDSSVTYEIATRLTKLLGETPGAEHYRFNVSLLPALLYMELRGIAYNKPAAEAKVVTLQAQLTKLQASLDGIAGRPMNIKSPKFKDFIYNELGLPAQKNRTTGKPTTNYAAMLTLAKKTDHIVPKLAMKISELRTRIQMLGIGTDPDHRIRCGYNIVGTETGRLTCYTSPTGSGYNLQTIPEQDRDLFEADPGHWFFQCDLSGADTWTVAAHCQRLGDDQMMEDLLTGVKPAKVLSYAFLKDTNILLKPAAEAYALSKDIGKDEPIYFGSKCCIHGSNYGMGKVLLSQTIFIQSEGKVNITSADAEKLQRLYFRRYPGVESWHNWIQSQLIQRKPLVSASGHRRVVFGDPKDHSVFKAALANEPQENTTYATNLAARRLWTDPENRRPDGSLIIEPLHQVHDALCGQFPKDQVEFAKRKIPEWFSNQIIIASVPLTIPYEGAYGPNWGNLNEGTL